MTITVNKRACPVCGRGTSVTVTGRLRKHKPSRTSATWCENTSPYGPTEKQ